MWFKLFFLWSKVSHIFQNIIFRHAAKYLNLRKLSFYAMPMHLVLHIMQLLAVMGRAFSLIGMQNSFQWYTSNSPGTWTTPFVTKRMQVPKIHFGKCAKRQLTGFFPSSSIQSSRSHEALGLDCSATYLVSERLVPTMASMAF